MSESAKTTSLSAAKSFCKRARCPSSEALLRYRDRADSFIERTVIEKHLRDCDFCSAEVELLKRHRNFREQHSIVEIPSHIRRLAEGVLAKAKNSSHVTIFIADHRELSH